jgi:hypothetical protein
VLPNVINTRNCTAWATFGVMGWCYQSVCNWIFWEGVSDTWLTWMPSRLDETFSSYIHLAFVALYECYIQAIDSQLLANRKLCDAVRVTSSPARRVGHYSTRNFSDGLFIRMDVV